MEEIVMTIVQADILPTIIVFEADVEHLELARRVVDIEKNEWIKYSTPNKGGAEYIAVCLPAFSPQNVHRDPE